MEWCFHRQRLERATEINTQRTSGECLEISLNAEAEIRRNDNSGS